MEWRSLAGCSTVILLAGCYAVGANRLAPVPGTQVVVTFTPLRSVVLVQTVGTRGADYDSVRQIAGTVRTVQGDSVQIAPSRIIDGRPRAWLHELDVYPGRIAVCWRDTSLSIQTRRLSTGRTVGFVALIGMIIMGRVAAVAAPY